MAESIGLSGKLEEDCEGGKEDWRMNSFRLGSWLNSPRWRNMKG